MSTEIRGLNELHARLDAISGPKFGRPFMEWVARQTVREAALRVAHKSGTTRRSIHIAAVTEDSATITVSAAGPFLEFGTKPHRIPKSGNARRPMPIGLVKTLGGRPRVSRGKVSVAAGFGAGGKPPFAWHVQHPGTQPRPFLVPAAKAIFTAAELDKATVKAWNGAA